MIDVSMYRSSEGVVFGNFKGDCDLFCYVILQFLVSKVRYSFLFIECEVLYSGESVDLEQWIIFPYGLYADTVGAFS